MRRFLQGFLVFLVCCSLAHAEWNAPEMRIAGSTETLPLVMTKVDASVSGVVADVQLSQRYENRGQTPVEAVYVFPVRRNAAVYAMQLRVGERQVRAVLERKEDARERYEQAVSEGRTASLLEQRDADVLSLSIGNILPGDDIEVTLSYTELLVPEDGRYRFFFPNTFGDSRSAEEVDASESTPLSLTSSDEAIEYALDVQVRLDSPVPIASVESPSHEVLVFDDGTPYSKTIQLSFDDARTAARDFIVDYRLQGDEIDTGILLHEEEGEGYFLLMAQPPRQVTRASIVPREYLFIVDVSGSMNGEPIRTVKELMRELILSLRPDERFNVLLFESAVEALTLDESLNASPENLDKALAVFDKDMGYGGTRLFNALEVAYALPQSVGYSRTLVVISDGHIAAGADVSALINANLDQGNVFAMGIGSGVSQEVIDRIARAGRAEPIFVDTREDSGPQAARLLSMIEHPLMTDIRLEFEGVDAFDLEPQFIPDVFAQRPVVVTGRYVPGTGGRAILTGRSAGRDQRYELGFRGRAGQYPAIKRLWARQRLTSWMDGRLDGRLPDSVDGRIEEIVQHSIEYSILSPWTAFVAVDERVRSDGQVERVQQPAVQRESTRTGGIGFAPIPAVIQLAPIAASLTTPDAEWLNADEYEAVAKPDGRLVLVLGDDDEFLEHASRYWSSKWSDQHVVSGIQSYQELLDVLSRHPNRGQEPWKELILISHASEWRGLSLPLVHGGEIASPSLLNRAVDEGLVRPLNHQLVDSSTRISIEGCGVGRRADVLSALSRLLGPQSLTGLYAYPGLVAYAEGEGGALLRQEVPYISSVVDSGFSVVDRLTQLTADMTSEFGPAGWDQWVHFEYPVRVEMILQGRAAHYRDPGKLAERHQPIAIQMSDLGIETDALEWTIEAGGHREPARLIGQGIVLVVRPRLAFEN